MYLLTNMQSSYSAKGLLAEDLYDSNNSVMPVNRIETAFEYRVIFVSGYF